MIIRANPLSQCDRIGIQPQVWGRPHVENHGRIEIGDRLRLNSVSARSHLVSGPRGTLRIGDDVSIDFGAGIVAHELITIGNRTRIGPFVMILDTDFHTVGRPDAVPSTTPVTIGHDVRLGAHVTILKGSRIADGATVMAGSVVAFELPAGAVAGGVPARVLTDDLAHWSRPAAPGARDGLVERLCQVIRTVFTLPAEPSLNTMREQIAGWDSLGTLRLILAVEDEFDVSLEEHDVIDAHDVAGLAAALQTRLGTVPSRRPTDW